MPRHSGQPRAKAAGLEESTVRMYSALPNILWGCHRGVTARGPGSAVPGAIRARRARRGGHEETPITTSVEWGPEYHLRPIGRVGAEPSPGCPERIK
jgi:hypothetical protein